MQNFSDLFLTVNNGVQVNKSYPKVFGRSDG